MKCSHKNIFSVAWVILVFSVVISVFVRLPFGFFDEQVHYVRSLGISNSQLLAYPKENDSNKLGHDIDSSNLRFVDRYLGNKSDVISAGWINDESEAKSGHKAYVVNTSAAPYTPIPYLPYATAVLVSGAINLDVKSEFITMRLFGAISSLMIVAAAFFVAPSRYRWSVIALSLIPMSIAAFAGISTDGFTIAIALLFMTTVARMVELIQKGTLANRHIVFLATVSVLLVMAKMPIFLMIALLLWVIIIFWKEIKKTHKIGLLLIIAITAAITLAWALYAKDINTGAYWGRNVDTAAQLTYIAENPLVFMKNLTYSMLNYDYVNITYLLYADSIFYSNIPFVIDMVVFVGLGLSAFVSVKHTHLMKQRVWLYWAQVALFVLIGIAMFVLLYLQFTLVGTPDAIEGVQPRYFLPFLPLLVMMPYGLALSRNIRIFTYSTPFIGVTVYLGYIMLQL